jgi:cell division protein ZapA
MGSESERKTVRVTIFNQTYTLAPTEDAREVETLGQTVDELMTSIAQRAGNMDSQRIAVLACLHLADRLRTAERELASLKGRVDEKTRRLSLLLDEAMLDQAVD